MISAPTDGGVDYYSRVAPDFHASYQNDPNRLERMRVWGEFLDRYAGHARFAYDIGCGSGILACELARRGIETVGIDGAAGMLTIAEQTAKSRSLSNVSFRQHLLPIADTQGMRRAQLVVSSSAIEYLDSMAGALRFLHDLLADEGTVVFSVSNRDSISRRIVRSVHRLTGRPSYLKFLRHFMTAEELAAATRAAGLTFLEHAYFGGADRLNGFLGAFLPQRYASNMIIVAARRDARPMSN
jgi:2-polyprenyl-3-methyl-5-hydroxy-6-metoxy-1,4-benzoquinol methylase